MWYNRGMPKTLPDIPRDAYEALLERVSGLELALSALTADNGQLASDNAELQARLERERAEAEARTAAAVEKAVASVRAEMQAAIDAQSAENARLLEQFKLLQMRHYGSSSERVDPNQLSLFNDFEAAAPEPEPEPEPEEAPARTKERRRGGKRLIDLSKLEEVVVEHDLKEGERGCPQCGAEMREIRVEVTEKVRMVPAHLVVEVHRTHVYLCEGCCDANAAGEETPSVIERAPRFDPFPGSLASPSLAAWVINQKYVAALPLYRIEQELASVGFPVSRADMSNWVMLAWERWLVHVRDRIRAYIHGLAVIHADETPVQVLREPGREAQSKSYCWVFCSSAWDHPAYDYVYNETRAGKVAEDYLSGWSGSLVTDGYGPYFSIGGVTNIACLAHIRRPFALLVKSAGGDAGAAASTGDLRLALDGRNLVDRIFAAEDAIGEVSPEERARLRAGDVARAMAQFESWCHAMLPHSTPGLKLEDALEYAIKYVPYTRNAVREGRAELTNNRAERAVKPFVIGRKNWLFSNTPRGAEASCGIYSVVTTARECGLSPIGYVEWLLTELPKLGERPDAKKVDRLLPWSEHVPDRLRVAPEKTRALREVQEEPIADVDPGALREDE